MYVTVQSVKCMLLYSLLNSNKVLLLEICFLLHVSTVVEPSSRSYNSSDYTRYVGTIIIIIIFFFFFLIFFFFLFFFLLLFFFFFFLLLLLLLRLFRGFFPVAYVFGLSFGFLILHLLISVFTQFRHLFLVVLLVHFRGDYY